MIEGDYDLDDKDESEVAEQNWIADHTALSRQRNRSRFRVFVCLSKVCPRFTPAMAVCKGDDRAFDE